LNNYEVNLNRRVVTYYQEKLPSYNLKTNNKFI